MNISTITPEETQNRLSQGAVLVDIRRPDEYRREHISGAVLQPLERIKQQGLPEAAEQASCVVFHCKSGMRTRHAAAVLAACCGGREAFVLEKGLDGWKAAGLPTEADPAQPLELMRQVQIAAGGLALSSALLGWCWCRLIFICCARLWGWGCLRQG